MLIKWVDTTNDNETRYLHIEYIKQDRTHNKYMFLMCNEQRD